MAGVDYRIILETSTSQSAIAFVRETGAVALMSKFPLAEHLPMDLVWRPIDVDVKYTTRILRPARLGQSTTVKSFINALLRYSDQNSSLMVDNITPAT